MNKSQPSPSQKSHASRQPTLQGSPHKSHPNLPRTSALDEPHNSQKKSRPSSARLHPDFQIPRKKTSEKCPEITKSPRELKIRSKTSRVETRLRRKSKKYENLKRDEPEPEVLEKKKVKSEPSSPNIKKKKNHGNNSGMESPVHTSRTSQKKKLSEEVEFKGHDLVTQDPLEIEEFVVPDTFQKKTFQGLEIQCFTSITIFPPQQFIENTVFILVDKEIRQRCKSWQLQIKEMIDLFKIPSDPKESDPTWQSFQGWLRLSNDGGFNFVEKFVTISGDKLFLSNDSEEFDQQHPQRKPINLVFSFSYSTTLLHPDPVTKSFPTYHMIRLITQEGTTYDLLCEDEHKAKLWNTKLDEIWKEEFIEGPVNLKKNYIEDFVSLIRTGFDLSLLMYEQLALYCVQCKWMQKKYLERQGSLKMTEGNNTIEVFVTLYSYFITLQEELITEDHPSCKIIDQIQLKFAIILDDEDEERGTNFIILTPKRKYTFQSRHKQAKQDWYSRISRGIANCQGVSLLDENEHYEMVETTYFYASSLIGRMSIRFSGEKNGITLRKDGPWLIGRSSTNHIVIEEDERISRTHCKIQLINNVPFLFDLGSSTCTFLEGERISEAPLKPGNNIRIGRTLLVFEVKDGDTIFFDRKDGKDMILFEMEDTDKYNDEKCTIS